MRMRLSLSVLLAGSLLLVAGCAAADPEVPAPPTPGPALSPAPEPGVPHGFVEPITEDAAQRTGHDPEGFIVRSSQVATWTESTMGCPEPGEQPRDEQVEGWAVIIRLEDPALDPELLLEYRVRADDGSFRFCEDSFEALPTPLEPRAPTPEPT